MSKRELEEKKNPNVLRNKQQKEKKSEKILRWKGKKKNMKNRMDEVQYPTHFSFPVNTAVGLLDDNKRRNPFSIYLRRILIIILYNLYKSAQNSFARHEGGAAADGDVRTRIPAKRFYLISKSQVSSAS